MTLSLGQVRKSLWGSLPKEAGAFKQVNTKAAQHLGKIFFTVIRCYHATLENSRLETLIPQLSQIEPELRGFAYEGAALGLMQLDCVLPWKKRLLPFLAGPASPYLYPAYVGAGVAMARMGKRPEQYLTRLDPVLGWLLIDGYGWRYGIFSRRSSVEEKAVPEFLSPYARRVFDQGLGRSIWFSTGATVQAITAILASFPQARQADLWSGVGFACAYAGGMDRAAIEALRAAAGSYQTQLAMGAAIGTKGRQRAGNLAPHTELACEILCGTSSNMAAYITDVALQNLPFDGVEPAYKIWRQRVEDQFALPAEPEISREMSLAN
jgi:enediyne biosynthesis protein E3